MTYMFILNVSGKMRSRIRCSIVGETMVGKTTLLKSYVTCKPPEIYSPTIYDNIKGMYLIIKVFGNHQLAIYLFYSCIFMNIYIVCFVNSKPLLPHCKRHDISSTARKRHFTRND